MGALSAAWIADKVGRRPTLGFIFSVRIVSSTLQYISTTNEIFFAGRFLGGFSTGATNSLCLAYIGEITPLPLRGILTAATPIALITGALSSALVVNFTGNQTTRWAYRIVFVSGYGFMGIALALLAFLPESPWWLASHGKPEKALKALQRIGYVSGADAEIKMAEIERVLAKTEEETSGATYADCFRRSNLRRTIVAAMPLTIQTFSGVAFVGSYSTYYQQLAGYSTAASFHLFIVQQVLSGAGNVVSWFLVDRVGRRKLTLWGMVMLTTILLITGGKHHSEHNPRIIREHANTATQSRPCCLRHTHRHSRHNRAPATLRLRLQRHGWRHRLHHFDRDPHRPSPCEDRLHLRRSAKRALHNVGLRAALLVQPGQSEPGRQSHVYLRGAEHPEHWLFVGLAAGECGAKL